MKTVLGLVALVIGIGAVGCSAEESAKVALVSDKSEVTTKAVWFTSLELAKAEAAKRNVPILANFSGSDWCGWCIKLDKEVFSTPVFEKYASESLVLLHLDFPRKKAQTAEIKKQNEELLEKFKVTGFPTIILLDAAGNLIEKTSYQPGGADNYVKHLSGLLKNKK